MTDRAWMMLQSGRRLDLLHPHPNAWTDDDLATRLARTYRWGSDSRWEHPLSVAQHSLTVLALRTEQAGRPLTAIEQLRELLHDADEGLLNFDAIAPLKPHLGAGYGQVAARLRCAINARYNLPGWDRASHEAHKLADRLAAASEAQHVVGWSARDIRESLGITLIPLTRDRLRAPPGMQPWEPWPQKLAATVFLDRLVSLQRSAIGLEDADGCRIVVLPPGKTQADPGDQPWEKPTLVIVDGGHETIEGLIVKGVRDEAGQWDLDGVFTVETDDGELMRVNGWTCVSEIVS